MKKICVITNHMDQGGVTSSLMNFCSELSRLGYAVDLLNLSGYYPENITGVSLLILKGFATYWNFGQSTYVNLSVIRRVLLLPLAVFKKVANRLGFWLSTVFREYKLQDSYDVVFAFNQSAPCYYFALNCVNARKKIALIHGDIDYMGKIESWSKMLNSFDKIACVSHAVEKGFRLKFASIESKFCTLYNIIDIDAIKSKSKDTSNIEFDTSIINIVTVSRHDNAQKGVDRIPEIVASLNKKRVENFHWYVIGGGADFDYNVQYSQSLGVNRYITFCGPIDNPFPLVGKADFLVLTSHTEAYGMVVAEAQVLNKPSVVASYPSLCEILRHDFNGIIADQSIDSLVDRIAEMIQNKDDVRTRLEKNLLDEPFSNSIAISQLISLIEN